MTIRIGTRGSVLARWQAEWCVAQLKQRGIETELVIIQTKGDVVQDKPLAGFGGQGVFTKEIQRALLENEADLAVHSLKDLPTQPVVGLTLAAVPKRASYYDVFVSNTFDGLQTLPAGAKIGTGSLRRKTQILYNFGDKFIIEDIRGNVETRLRKLDEGQYDALILAEAGLERLGLGNRIRSRLEPPFFLPAIGQGALGLEIRTDDKHTAALIAPLSDKKSFLEVSAERAFLRTLQAGCSSPTAALALFNGEELVLHGRILSPDGRKMLERITSGTLLRHAETLGIQLAEELLHQGAAELLC
ncbi:MAG: hydroxymethylbilane synthase [Planctomycetaceae bacterium]|nr:hydroxymethylbilane synthase [Planctomycetaceae bacterium]